MIFNYTSKICLLFLQDALFVHNRIILIFLLIIATLL